ncbi:uncharacterized protein BYT42DRAFT_573636 [Radiomyces spectabilis]|uniref:uncharacterized protein n=1 Tax=Radiomyces spectabilis TaxID=64574 RepID=UPI0022210A47|nr:uncharacterized protein BYT42DRAFT_573636 [Radiomyces spectabilis]KAI8376160.1 hypothetical protein BYT42DRAFT_573636 [Radiomyces spectabilis]
MAPPIATLSAAIGVPALILILTHLKSLPLAYTFRSWLLLRSLVKRATMAQLCPDPLFTVVSQDYRCLLDDIDYNQHMNNSTYNKMLDFSRIHLLYAVFPKMMMEPNHNIFGHNAGVLTLFKKEIAPFQQYTIQTRVWTWNQKWLWLQHRFVIPAEGDQTEPTVACVAVSKLVFKRASGKTVSPAEVLELCGHFVNNPTVEERRARNWETAANLLKLDTLFTDRDSWENTLCLSML